MSDNLPITAKSLHNSIVNDTPDCTKKLLIKLEPEYWKQFWPELDKPILRIVK